MDRCHSSIFQNLEYRNKPTHPDMKEIIDNANSRYISLLRCARSRFRKINAPSPIRPKKSTSLPSRLKFN
ncbi:MAG TPA: hypothetical protein VJ571_07420 [Candidatus Nitrosotalea sp.]|nr:hypothetical protein [Candidatus Nitrosotalea sp.]